MKVHTVFLAAFGLAVATGAQAQTAPAPVDPLTSLQNTFGAIVGYSFHVPDQITGAVVPPQASAAVVQPLGGVLRTSLQVPGAAFAALFIPFDTDLATPAAPAAAPPAPASRHRRAKAAHRRPVVKPTIG